VTDRRAHGYCPTHAHEPVGEFWLSVARMVIDQMAQQAAPPVRRGTSGVQ